MSAEPLAADGRTPPAPPRPAGVVDLGRYRGRTGGGPAVGPPPREGDDAANRSPLTDAVVVPVVPQDRSEPPGRVRAAAETRVTTVIDDELVIRRLHLGSVLRMAFGFSLCAAIVGIGAGVLIWVTISTLGVVENLESLAEDLGWVDVSFDGPAMLRAALIGGGILVVAASLLSVVFAEVFNLLSTITGGLKADVGPAPLTRRDRRRIRKALKRRAREAAKVVQPTGASSSRPKTTTRLKGRGHH